ncbi:MBOAT family O-acyltransferase [Butyrivibrio proteoclasticus]|uniref:MBOAT family O-acyltransferase n=1 Tax=Butyrivibrio proteoclasticus TaxID=43305 RepID=UPI0006886ABB|nr:MBOAT family O-acyltransferase [Butyrivibrio proteoclasticus]
MTVGVTSVLYALVICILFYILRGNSRKYLLAVASILYIYSLNRLAGAVVLFVSVFTWAVGLLVSIWQKKSERAATGIMSVAVSIFVLSLLILKYFPAYFSQGAAEDSFLSKILMPIGYSFYVFQAISYIVDVKRKSVKPTTNIADVVLYLAWFPKFVSGPIERWNGFNDQIKNACCAKLIDKDRWKRVFYYTLYGAFMKVVIADRLGIYVDKIFDGAELLGSNWLLLGALFYTVQIYCDFAGYSYFAIGVSKAFGIDLVMNFDMPYCSQNITEFWRRWHMSLSSWLRDYVYIPLGGNRKGPARKIINTMIVFLICGMWHGAGKNFIVWGLLHGVFSAVDSICRDKGFSIIRKGVVGTIITFLEASFAWIFFRASSLSAGLRYVKAMFTHFAGYISFAENMENINLVMIEMVVIIVSILCIAVLDRIAYNGKSNIPEMIASLTQGRRYIVCYLLLMILVIFGIYGPDISTRLIYMEF